MPMDKINISRAIELLSAENTPYQLLTWNCCYGGGPDLSEEASKAYTEYLTRQGVETRAWNVHFLRFIKHFRSEDPKRRFARGGSAFAFALIKTEQAPFYRFSEYDGIEDPYMDTPNYILQKIKVHFQQKDTMSQKEYAEYSCVEHEFIDIECHC
jgi:hypothetical protein